MGVLDDHKRSDFTNLAVGEKVVIRLFHNWGPDDFVETTVAKIGKLHFHVADARYAATKFRLSNGYEAGEWRSGSPQIWRITPGVIEDMREAKSERIVRNDRQRLGSIDIRNLPHDKVVRILAIVDEKPAG